MNLIQVDDFFGLVIEEVHLHPCDAGLLQRREQLSAFRLVLERSAMPPHEDSDSLLS